MLLHLLFAPTPGSPSTSRPYLQGPAAASQIMRPRQVRMWSACWGLAPAKNPLIRLSANSCCMSPTTAPSMPCSPPEARVEGAVVVHVRDDVALGGGHRPDDGADVRLADVVPLQRRHQVGRGLVEVRDEMFILSWVVRMSRQPLLPGYGTAGAGQRADLQGQALDDPAGLHVVVEEVAVDGRIADDPGGEVGHDRADAVSATQASIEGVAAVVGGRRCSRWRASPRPDRSDRRTWSRRGRQSTPPCSTSKMTSRVPPGTDLGALWDVPDEGARRESSDISRVR